MTFQQIFFFISRATNIIYVHIYTL